MKITFNKPYLTGKETLYIEKAVASGKISGNGFFTKNAMLFLNNNMGLKRHCSPLLVRMP